MLEGALKPHTYHGAVHTWGFMASASENSASSWLIARKSPKGSGEEPLTT